MKLNKPLFISCSIASLVFNWCLTPLSKSLQESLFIMMVTFLFFSIPFWMPMNWLEVQK